MTVGFAMTAPKALLLAMTALLVAACVGKGRAAASSEPRVIRPSEWTAQTDQDGNLVRVGGAAYRVENAGRPWSFGNPQADDSTLRFELRSGDHWSSAAWADPPTRERTEISAVTQYAVGTDIHAAYDFTVEPGAANTARWLVIGQFHQASSSWSPPFDIELVGEKMAVKINTAGAGANSWSQYRTLWIDPEDIVRGRTYHIEFNIRFDPANGHLDFWRDGVRLADYDGPLGWSDMGAYTYWKQGVYRAASDATIAVAYSGLKITAVRRQARLD